jgi:GntR family transcriptional regulator
MYLQIAADLRRKIESGQLGHGAQLPTELELREQYGNASRNTVRDAIKWLVTRGLVETRPGHGTFVVEKINPFVTSLDHVAGFVGAESVVYVSEVEATSRESTVSIPRIEIQAATSVIARDLQLPVGTQVVTRHQLRSIDGTPYSLQTTFYPLQYVRDGADRLIQAEDIPEGAVAYIEKVLRVKQTGWHDKITVRAPDLNETAFFRLPSDGRVAVIEIRRTAFKESGEPLRLTVTVYPADRNQFVMTAGDVPRETSPSPAAGTAVPGENTASLPQPDSG